MKSQFIQFATKTQSYQVSQRLEKQLITLRVFFVPLSLCGTFRLIGVDSKVDCKIRN